MHIPIIICTALADHASKLKGIQSGCTEFLTKPFDFIELKIRIKNLVQLKLSHDSVIHAKENLEEKVQQRTFELNKTLNQVKQMEQELRLSQEETINRLYAVLLNLGMMRPLSI